MHRGPEGSRQELALALMYRSFAFLKPHQTCYELAQGIRLPEPAFEEGFLLLWPYEEIEERYLKLARALRLPEPCSDEDLSDTTWSDSSDELSSNSTG
jgi:hypothetical protein